MIFAGHSRIGTLGSCVEAAVVVMLCEMKGDGSLYVLEFSSFWVQSSRLSSVLVRVIYF